MRVTSQREELMQDVPEEFGEYNLTNPDEQITPLQEDWELNTADGLPLIIVDQNTGKLWQISVDPQGIAITVHPIIQKMEIGEGGTTLKGPDAWLTLDQEFPRYAIVPQTAIGDSSVEAHVALARNPLWLKAIQQIVATYLRTQSNPYTK